MSFTVFKRGKSGFFITVENNITFYDNQGKGHTANARQIIDKNGWNKDYDNSDYKDEQDYLIFKRGAVQVGSSTNQRKVIAAARYFKEPKLKKFMNEYDIEDYDYTIMEY